MVWPVAASQADAACGPGSRSAVQCTGPPTHLHAFVYTQRSPCGSFRVICGPTTPLCSELLRVAPHEYLTTHKRRFHPMSQSMLPRKARDPLNLRIVANNTAIDGAKHDRLITQAAVLTSRRIVEGAPMQLPIILDDSGRFSCGSCTQCCDQPWRTVIEADKAAALDRHDWTKYPQLAGHRFYHAPADGQPGMLDLAKGEGTKCIFLDIDKRCIIHKELGAAAKPAMCRQFPYLPSVTL